MSDFFWREALPLNVIKGDQDLRTLDSGIIGVCRYGKGEVVLCQISPDMFKDSRAWTKTSRVVATLLSNLGVRAKTPNLCAGELKADDSPYARPWVSFNPYQYTGW